MSAHMKKHPTKKQSRKEMLRFMVRGRQYSIPQKIADKYIVTPKKTEETVSSDEVFESLTGKLSRAGALLKGLRVQEAMTQAVFAREIGVTQANLSKMETGKRNIGRVIAKRIEAKFEVDYRRFLE